MSTTLLNMIGSVNAELSDYAVWQLFTGTGDGTTTIYQLGDAPVVPGSEEVTVDSSQLVEDVTLPVTAGQYYLNDATAEVIFGTAPADTKAISILYQYKHWDDDFIAAKLNEAIDLAFHEFYTEGTAELDVTAGTYEYATDLLDTDRITQVEYDSDGVYVRISGWRAFNVAGTKYLKLTRGLSGTLRLHYISHPARLANTSDDLDDAGLPARASTVLVPYACWACLHSSMARRARSDYAHNRRGENNVTMREILYAASQYQMKWQLALEKLKMSAPRGRVVA